MYTKFVRWPLDKNYAMKVVLAKCVACDSISVIRADNPRFHYESGIRHSISAQEVKISCNRCGHTDNLGGFNQEME